MEKLSAKEALLKIEELLRTNKMILGVDGFILADGAHIASLDLMLDTSADGTSIEEAAAAAKEFVIKKKGPSTVFEVWAESS